MGDKRTMASRIDEKLAAGFSCIKLKIGAIDFDDECELLAAIRRRYSREDIELRVDANGVRSLLTMHWNICNVFRLMIYIR